MKRRAEDIKQRQKKRNCPKRKQEMRTCSRKIEFKCSESEESGKIGDKELCDDDSQDDAGSFSTDVCSVYGEFE
jgi:hypothetical protein